ncbi:MAG TPA: 2-amino-4-hydroxy-6-hydroxymethyldihydropteridine diphosphokinase [Planctomicrobium sp.]|nr:2-amino-4-hydroxy-6-hydroxymethyldihydropteridine diphosphokinase [Planctomicrobium sp.]
MSNDLTPHLVWIALGSNIEPEQNLPAAAASLGLLGEVKKCSSVWQSKPVGDENQSDFCNAALFMETELELYELRHSLRMIEEQLGRVRDPDNKNGARTIDLDIAMFDELVISTSEMTIPDPEIESRPFLSIPLAELTPDQRHPVSGITLQEIAGKAEFENLLRRRDDIELLC